MLKQEVVSDGGESNRNVKSHWLKSPQNSKKPLTHFKL